jgi:hypothetical protein
MVLNIYPLYGKTGLLQIICKNVLELCSRFSLRARSWYDGNHSSSFGRIMVSSVIDELLYLGRSLRISPQPAHECRAPDYLPCRYDMFSIVRHLHLCLVPAPVHRIRLLGALTETRQVSCVDVSMLGELFSCIVTACHLGDRGYQVLRYGLCHHNGRR